MLTLLFWMLVIASLYSYFIYPLVLAFLTRNNRRSKPRSVTNHTRTYSLIVAVHNEEKLIADKIRNMLALTFDSKRLELIIASDCSTDKTDAIVGCFKDQGVKWVRANERLGKENAQLSGIRASSGQILIFSDVATIMKPDAIQKLDAYFEDDEIGAVSSEDRFLSNSGEVAGEGAYVKYEMWLRSQESKLAGLVGLSGSFFAARREICKHWDIHAYSDFVTALNCANAGKRSVTAPDVLGYYRDLKDPAKEYARKVRTALQGMTGLSRHKDVLYRPNMHWFAFQVYSHKVLRWGVPWFLMALLATSVALAEQGGIYQFALLAQLMFYFTALLAHINCNLQQYTSIKIVHFFVSVNVALLEASLKFLSGQKMIIWQPSQRV